MDVGGQMSARIELREAQPGVHRSRGPADERRLPIARAPPRVHVRAGERAVVEGAEIVHRGGILSLATGRDKTVEFRISDIEAGDAAGLGLRASGLWPGWLQGSG